MAVSLIDRVLLYPDKEIKVVLRHSDQFEDIMKFLAAQGAQDSGSGTETDINSEKEAV